MRLIVSADALKRAHKAEARELNRTSKKPRPLRDEDRHLRDDPGQNVAFVRKGEIFICRHLGRITKQIKIGETRPGKNGGSVLYWEASKYSLDLRLLNEPIKREARKRRQPVSAGDCPAKEQEVSMPPARAVSEARSRMSATDAETGPVSGLSTQRTGPA